MPKPTTLERVRALLSNCSNLSAVAREADVNLRTLYRIRDGEQKDVTTGLADRILVAAKRHQRKQAA